MANQKHASTSEEGRRELARAACVSKAFHCAASTVALTRGVADWRPEVERKPEAEERDQAAADAMELDGAETATRPVKVEVRSIPLVPIRPRWRGERRSLRTFPGASLRPHLAFNSRPRRLSTPTDANELHPDIALYGTTLRARRSLACRCSVENGAASGPPRRWRERTRARASSTSRAISSSLSRSRRSRCGACPRCARRRVASSRRSEEETRSRRRRRRR